MPIGFDNFTFTTLYSSILNFNFNLYLAISILEVDKTISKEVGKQSSELRMKLVQWRVACAFTSHNNEKCETIFNEGWCVTLHHTTMRSVRLYSMKGGVWLYITQQWEVWDYIQWRVVCDYITQQWEVWDYIQWRVVCEITLHNNEKCANICNEGWCVSLHYTTMRSVLIYAMKGGVWVYIT